MRQDISYVVIDTLNYELSTHALARSLEQFPLENILIFSDNPDRWAGHGIIKIPEIRSTEDYNRVIFFELPKHLNTEYAIFIQYDGFVISGDSFSDGFLSYDYIGAPWPHHKECNVGNGGFSLRSSKLIRAVQEFVLPSDLQSPEDVVICRYLRARLEDAADLRYAPTDVADDFSYEMKNTQKSTFGFHGIFHLPIVMQNDLNLLFDNLSPRSVVRLFRAFRDACELLPEQQRELFYNYCRVNSSELLMFAKANASNVK